MLIKQISVVAKSRIQLINKITKGGTKHGKTN